MCRNYHSAAGHNVQQHHKEATNACLTSWKDQVVDLVCAYFYLCVLLLENEDVAAGHGLTNEQVSDVHISCSLYGPVLITLLCLITLDSQTQYSAEADR